MEFTQGATFLMSRASSSSSTPTPTPVVTPCTACKISRRKCSEDCVLAPRFSPTDRLKFTTLNKVFGVANIIKLLQSIPEGERSNAVHSMLIEANARLNEPIYGCAGLVFDLKAQLEEAEAEIVALRRQQANLAAHFSWRMGQMAQYAPPLSSTLLSQMGQTAQYSPPPLLTLLPPGSMVSAGFPPDSYPNWFNDDTNLDSLREPF